MKKKILLLTLVFFFSACSSDTTSVKNDRNIENNIIKTPELYKKVTRVTFKDKKDLDNFKEQLGTLNSIIGTQTGSIKPLQVIEKARLLDYLGQTGEALKLYVDNFDKDKNSVYLAYNHNMGRLYEKLNTPKEAKKRYEFILEYFKKESYHKDIARTWNKIGDNIEYKKHMKLYEVYKEKKNKGGVKNQNIKVDSDGNIEIK